MGALLLLRSGAIASADLLVLQRPSQSPRLGGPSFLEQAALCHSLRGPLPALGGAASPRTWKQWHSDLLDHLHRCARRTCVCMRVELKEALRSNACLHLVPGTPSVFRSVLLQNPGRDPQNGLPHSLLGRRASGRHCSCPGVGRLGPRLWARERGRRVCTTGET